MDAACLTALLYRLHPDDGLAWLAVDQNELLAVPAADEAFLQVGIRERSDAPVVEERIDDEGATIDEHVLNATCGPSRAIRHSRRWYVNEQLRPAREYL